MDLATVFNLIRSEPVCLFLGSGFSLYAGMPTSKKLTNLLCGSLNQSQLGKIEVQQDLRKFTEDYQTLFGRVKLVNVLQQHIDIAPTERHLHDLLAKIPYFKSIITTNYDRLIEDSMGDNGCAIVNNSHVFGSKRAKTRIFKIHGDIRDGDSIVITTSDYAKQYNRAFKDPFWASVISEISAQHIIFLGYGYEDENVWADFDYIEQKLQNRSKKRILISPNISSVKKKRLKKANIDYVQSDSDAFINGLVSELKSHIVEDHRQGLVDTQIAQDFITSFDLKVDIRSSKGASQLTNISRVDGPTNHTFKFTTSNQELMQSYGKFTSDYSVRDLKISPEQLDNFALLIEDFTFLDKSSLAHFKVEHIPKYDNSCKIRFPEQNFTLQKTHCRLYNSIPKKVLIEADVAGFKANFSFDATGDGVRINFKITEPEQPSAVNKCYEVLRALYLFFSGESVEIIPKVGKSFKHRLPAQAQAVEFKTKMEFVYTLKRIEKAFQIKFPAISLGEITDEDEKKVQKLRNLLNHGYHAIREDDGLVIERMPRSKPLFDQLKSDIISKGFVSFATKSGDSIELFGRVLYLGSEQVSINQPTVAELDFEKQRMKLMPIDNLIIFHYKKFGLWKIPNSQTLWSGK